MILLLTACTQRSKRGDTFLTETVIGIGIGSVGGASGASDISTQVTAKAMTFGEMDERIEEKNRR